MFDALFNAPNLLIPDRKPLSPVVIDRDHPIGKKILHFYLFNDYGTIAYDLAETQVNGTLTGGMTWATSERGRSLESNGTTGRVDFSSSTDMSIYSNGFSIVTRVNPDTFTGADARLVFKAPGGAGTQYALWADIGNTCWAAASYDTGFRLADNNASTVDTGVWQDVALVFDYANVSLWKDAVSYQSTGATALASTTGAKYFCANNAGAQDLDGKVEFVMYFTEPLTGLELLEIKRDAYQILKPANEEMIHFEEPVAVSGNPWYYYANQ